MLFKNTISRRELALSTGAALVGTAATGTGAVTRTAQQKERDWVSIKDFGAIGNGSTNDLASVQAANDSGALFIFIPSGTFNLNAGTLTLSAGVALIFAGGALSNGTVACNGNSFVGSRGLTQSITLSGIVGDANTVLFDWFTCEKSTLAQYSTFINGASASFSTIPSISTVNKTILAMLMTAGYSVKFGAGIYPFDAEIAAVNEFRFAGLDKNSTLLWCPNSSFLHFSSGGATYPYLKNLTIEANNNVIKTQSNTVNAFHGLVLENAVFVSYADHAFMNDYSVAGGTGCPIYGSKVVNVAVYAGAAKGGFYGWTSGSNIFDNVVDMHMYFNGQWTNVKGIPTAIFYNSNVKKYCNSNVTYAGIRYVYYWDKLNVPAYFIAQNNVFENNSYGFYAVCKIINASNAFLDTSSNQYIGKPSENGYHYITSPGTGNVYVSATDSNTPIYGDHIRNVGDQYIRSVTTKLDRGATQYRLCYHEPHTVDTSNAEEGTRLIAPTAALCKLIGMENIYAADSAHISYIQIRPSARMQNSRFLAFGQGTTATRPTTGLYIGYQYFDTTLGYPIWHNGTGWKNASGTTV